VAEQITNRVEPMLAPRDDSNLGREAPGAERRLAPHETSADGDALRREVHELRGRLRQLEQDLAGYRAREELLNTKLLLATDYAARVTEEARRDAQIALRKARAKADEVLGGIERERSRAERELLRLHQVTAETRASLSGFLTTALEQLRVPEDGAGPSASAADAEEALRDVLRRKLQTDEPPSRPPFSPNEVPNL
jgi:cell division septum initiation protein DivIVA